VKGIKIKLKKKQKKKLKASAFSLWTAYNIKRWNRKNKTNEEKEKKSAMLDPRVIFIILIIILNLHDSSLSESSYNTWPKSLGCGSGCKVVS
jgi:hypothetical protein